MQYNHIAHINETTKEIQTVKQHCEAVAQLCREYAVPEFKDFAYGMGLAHDIGKYQESFGDRIKGDSTAQVEHSTCGALVVRDKYMNSPLSLMMEYCITGHHTGIPDGGFPNDTGQEKTLHGRMQRQFEDFSIYQEELLFPEIDLKKWLEFILRDCDKNENIFIDKFAFFTRYMFSCLVDADSKDTADFCRWQGLPRQLKANFNICLDKVDKKLFSFKCQTTLQKTRAELQGQAFDNSKQNAEIYLLNMPTGSGKTLASVKIAIEKAIASGKKRIIYIIPYNSIIDQTAEVFEELFGSDLEILRHQSTFSYEDDSNESEDYREAAKFAAENWQAPFIITTAVQFFESIYANKRGKLRKLHNMADSILIFDEAHLMPEDYLQPCLQSIAYITKYLNSEAIFLTATMPNFSDLMKEYALPSSRIISLIEDTSSFTAFKKCRYSYLGEMEAAEILSRSSECPSSLIIVNRKATARELFKQCTGKKYHLSTYMTAFDRKRVLKDIREEVNRLAEDYPDMEHVPVDRRITIVSTSLIEAGVDLDVHTVFRELSGLDSILQAGGRCNREGKRIMADVFIFEFANGSWRNSTDIKRNLAKGLLKKYADISDIDCILEYYKRLFYMNREAIQKHSMHNKCSGNIRSISSIPFKEYAEEFELIDTKTVSLVAVRDGKSRMLVERLKSGQDINVRELQNYTCTLYQKELDDLIEQHVADDYKKGIFCLTNSDYYDEQVGVLFEAKDYFL